MTTVGTTPDYWHLLIECRSCAPDRIDNPVVIRRILRRAAMTCRLHVLQQGMHRFEPHGITAYALLSESHVSVHTWPELGFALVDVLSCAKIPRASLVASLQELLAPAEIIVRARGSLRAGRLRSGPPRRRIHASASSA
jgi:S-adenosylmethionine decarboxylase proenzyme